MENIRLIQINTTTFDIEGNLSKITQRISETPSKNIVLQNYAITGGFFENVFERYPILLKNQMRALEKLASVYADKVIISGAVFKEGDKFVNRGVILKNGKVKMIDLSESFDFAGLKTSICLDRAFENSGTDLIISLFPYLSKTNEEYKRNSELSNMASKNNAYVIQVNPIGGNDEFSFDGSSRMYDKDGKLLLRAEFFNEDSVDTENLQIKSMPKGLDKKQNFSLDYENDLERTYLSAIQSIKDYFSKNGLKKAVLGLSGGLDSTICAVLLTKALGRENVLGVSMPSKITTDLSKQDGYQLAQNLKIDYKEIPISPVVDALKTNLNFECDWLDKCEKSFAMDNFQARTRATILYGISNECRASIPVATSDKSEAYMGYATINGDMSGGFAPIADVTKSKLFALAKYINKNIENVIPESVINKRPGAELAINPKTNKPLLAEEALMPYDFLDEVIFRIEVLHQDFDELKRTEFEYEKTHNDNQKEEWLKKFFKRMLGASCKGYLMPVAPISDENSINKAIYRAPVTSKMKFYDLKGVL